MTGAAEGTKTRLKHHLGAFICLVLLKGLTPRRAWDHRVYLEFFQSTNILPRNSWSQLLLTVHKIKVYALTVTPSGWPMERKNVAHDAVVMGDFFEFV